MERNSKKEFIINFLYTVIVFGIALLSFYVIVKFLLPFVIGAVIALLVSKPAKLLSEKIKLSVGALSVILSLLFFVIVGGLICFLIYKIILFGLDLTDYLPSFFDYLKKTLESISERYANIFARFPAEIKEMINNVSSDTIQKIIAFAGETATRGISTIIKKVPLIFLSGIVTLVASCYIAKDFKGLKGFVKSLTGNRVWQNTAKIKNIVIGSVFKLLKGYLLLLTITAAELFTGFLILGVSKPLLLAVLIAFIDLLPVLGTGTVMIPWAVITVLSDNVAFGIGLSVLYLIIILLRNFLEPKIIGTQVGINPLFTLIAMFLGLKILGFWGIILFPVILIVTIKYYKDEMEEGLSV